MPTLRVLRAAGLGVLLAVIVYVVWLIVIGSDARSILFHRSVALASVDATTQYVLQVGNVLLLTTIGAATLVTLIGFGIEVWQRMHQPPASTNWVKWDETKWPAGELRDLYFQILMMSAESRVTEATSGATPEHRANGVNELLQEAWQLKNRDRMSDAVTLFSALATLHNSSEPGLKHAATRAAEGLKEVAGEVLKGVRVPFAEK